DALPVSVQEGGPREPELPSCFILGAVFLNRLSGFPHLLYSEGVGWHYSPSGLPLSLAESSRFSRMSLSVVRMRTTKPRVVTRNWLMPVRASTSGDHQGMDRAGGSPD